MTKQQHIDYWLKNADRDWVRAENCFKQKDYVFCLFCLHMSLEKICKTLWVKENKSNTPPKIHDLVKLLHQSNIELPNEDLMFMLEMNTYQLEGRYPDYHDKIYRITKRNNAKSIFEKCQQLKEKLQSLLP